MKLELDKQNRLCKDLSRRLDILQKVSTHSSRVFYMVVLQKYEVSEGHTGTLIKVDHSNFTLIELIPGKEWTNS